MLRTSARASSWIVKMAEIEDDGDDLEIIEEYIAPPSDHKLPTLSATSANLSMECDDEDLSPQQKEQLRQKGQTFSLPRSKQISTHTRLPPLQQRPNWTGQGSQLISLAHIAQSTPPLESGNSVLARNGHMSSSVPVQHPSIPFRPGGYGSRQPGLSQESNRLFKAPINPGRSPPVLPTRIDNLGQLHSSKTDGSKVSREKQERKKASGTVGIRNVAPLDLAALMCAHEKPLPPPPPTTLTPLDKQQRGALIPVQSHTLIQDPRIYYMRGYSYAVVGREERIAEEFLGSFRCPWCDLLSPTNVSHVFHLRAHLEEEPRFEEEEGDPEPGSELEDFRTCRECHWDFETPFQLMEHSKTVHIRPQQPSSSICYICDAHFSDSKILVRHMQGTHTEGPDAPYWCKICRFRSSLLSDLKTHFAREHGGTRLLCCPLCLYVSEASISLYQRNKTNSRKIVATTKGFFQHLIDHVNTWGKHRCHRCVLIFVTAAELAKHLKEEHSRTIETSCRGKPSAAPKLIRCIGYRPISLEEEAGGWRDRRLLRPETKTVSLRESFCVECRQPLNQDNHFTPNSLECSVCSFVTTCYNSHFNHMMVHAKQTPDDSTFVFRKKEAVTHCPWACPCGFASTFGNRLAAHLRLCPESEGQSSLAVLPMSSDEEARGHGVPHRMLKGLRMKTKETLKREREESGSEDSDREDEIKLEAKRQAMMERKVKEMPRPDETPLGTGDRPHRIGLLSPRKSKPKPNFSEEPARKPQLDQEAGGGKMTKDEHIFVERGASADKVGERYRRFRERAVSILPDIEDQSVPTDSKLPSAMHKAQLSELAALIVASDIEVPKDAVKDAEEATIKMETGSHVPSEVPVESEDQVDYTNLLSELGISREEEKAEQNLESEGSENLFSRIEAIFT